jgi:hypothetical protein
MTVLFLMPPPLLTATRGAEAPKAAARRRPWSKRAAATRVPAFVSRGRPWTRRPSPGPLSELDIFAVLPFSNFLSVVPAVPRERFKELLEDAVSRVEATDGRFDQVVGFRVTWDARGAEQGLDAAGHVTTPGSRVREVVLDEGTAIVTGGTVVPGPPLDVATMDCLARGGDRYPFRGAAFTVRGASRPQALRSDIADALGGKHPRPRPGRGQRPDHPRARMAHDMGHQCGGLTRGEIRHARV